MQPSRNVCNCDYPRDIKFVFQLKYEIGRACQQRVGTTQHVWVLHRTAQRLQVSNFLLSPRRPPQCSCLAQFITELHKMLMSNALYQTNLQLSRLKRREPIADNFARMAVHTHRPEKRRRDLMLPEELLLNHFGTSHQPTSGNPTW